MSAQPHATIACQDLLSTPNVGYNGFLRKKIVVPKMKMDFLKQVTDKIKIPWVRRYVVLSEGSLYHFDNEMSRKPSGCYSLKEYKQVVRAGDIPQSEYPWAFKICHGLDNNNDRYFAAASEAECKKWQNEISCHIRDCHPKNSKSSVKSSHSTPQPAMDDDEDHAMNEYDEIREVSQLLRPLPQLPESEYETEKPAVNQSGNKKRHSVGIRVWPTDLQNELGKHRQSSPIRVDTKARVIPPIPTPETTRARHPLPAEMPICVGYESLAFSRKDIFWDGHDKEACDQILKTIGEDGVFLVRGTGAGHGQTLVVHWTGGKISKYKIHLKMALYTIDHKFNFDTLEELIRHYMHNTLPGRSSKLGTPYGKFMD